MARLNSLDPRAPSLSPSAIRVVGAQFIEADGGAAGTYIKDIKFPAYAALLNVLVHNVALWTAGTSAKMEVGWYSDASGAISTVIDADDVFTDIDLKATDLLAGEAVDFNRSGGLHGDLGGLVATQLHLIDAVDNVDRWLRLKVTTTGTLGDAGITLAYVEYALPEMDVAVFAAT